MDDFVKQLKGIMHARNQEQKFVWETLPTLAPVKPVLRPDLSVNDIIEVLRALLPEEGAVIHFLRDFFPHAGLDPVIEDYVREACPRYFWNLDDYQDLLTSLLGSEGDEGEGAREKYGCRTFLTEITGSLGLKYSRETRRADGKHHTLEIQLRWSPSKFISHLFCQDRVRDPMGDERCYSWCITEYPKPHRTYPVDMSPDFEKLEGAVFRDLMQIDRETGQLLSYDLMADGGTPLHRFLAHKIRGG